MTAPSCAPPTLTTKSPTKKPMVEPDNVKYRGSLNIGFFIASKPSTNTAVTGNHKGAPIIDGTLGVGGGGGGAPEGRSPIYANSYSAKSPLLTPTESAIAGIFITKAKETKPKIAIFNPTIFIVHSSIIKMLYLVYTSYACITRKSSWSKATHS